MSIAIVFTGQGSQQINMGHDFYEKFPVDRELFDLFPEVRDRCFNGEELNNTRYTQACLFLCNYILASHLPIKADYCLGLSLGEYNALCYADSFDLHQGVKLVKKRGAIMADALNEGTGMYAVIKNNGFIAEIVDQYDQVEIANYNSSEQTIIAGYKEQLKEVAKKLKEKGCRCIPLKVSGAFHTSFLKEAAEQLEDFLQEQEIKEPTKNVVYNYSGCLKTPGVIKNLKMQICNPVRFKQSITYLKEQGVDTFIEIGVGNVVSKLIKANYPEANVYQLGTVEDLQILEEKYGK